MGAACRSLVKGTGALPGDGPMTFAQLGDISPQAVSVSAPLCRTPPHKPGPRAFCRDRQQLAFLSPGLRALALHNQSLMPWRSTLRHQAAQPPLGSPLCPQGPPRMGSEGCPYTTTHSETFPSLPLPGLPPRQMGPARQHGSRQATSLRPARQAPGGKWKSCMGSEVMEETPAHSGTRRGLPQPTCPASEPRGTRSMARMDIPSVCSHSFLCTPTLERTNLASSPWFAPN